MIVVAHRINTIGQLAQVPERYGVEIDVRGVGGDLLLSHDPIRDARTATRLEDYLTHFRHALLVLNLKDAGNEQQTIDVAARHGIESYFLLDVSVPYLYSATRQGFRKLAVRFSEVEPIEGVLAHKLGATPLAEWVWIDTFTRLPLSTESVAQLRGFRTCLVCPERWGRPEDIPAYIRAMREFEFTPDAVMTSLDYAAEWERADAL